MTGRRAVFIDRDGVLNALTPDPDTGNPEGPLSPNDVALLPGVAPALRKLSKAGWILIGVTNQPAAAKGTCSLDEIQVVQARVLALLAAEGARFDDFRLCPHHPDGSVPGLTRKCGCRKPEPGMLLAAAREHGIELSASWMIGDTDSDVEAGVRAGCRTVLITHALSAHKRGGGGRADAEAADLPGAVRILMSRTE